MQVKGLLVPVPVLFELDASIMEGKDLTAGAVAGVENGEESD